MTKKYGKLAFAKAYIISLIFILQGIGASISAQEITETLLPKSEAIRVMLENNFDIKVADNDITVASNNASLLNSGYLPSVYGLAGISWDRTSNTTDFGGATIDGIDPTTLDTIAVARPNNVITGAETTRYNASINVDYTLFDGLGRFYTYKQLKEQYGLTQLQARETIENTMLQLFSVYYEVARLQENIVNLEQAIEITKKRVLRAQYQFEYGQVNKLEILNAEVDIVTDSTNILNARQDLRNAQRDLNVVLARDIEDLRYADTTVVFVSELMMDSYTQKAKENNVSLLQAETAITISDYDVKVAKGLFLPTVGLTGSYGWNRSNNPASAFFPSTTSISNGLAAGASLRWDLFNGGNSVISVKNARIVRENQELFKEQLSQQVLRDIANAKGNYKNALKIYELQEQNVTTSLANFERSEERFKLGQITNIEFRQAQLNLLNVQTTKNAAKYTAKLAEVQLLQLAGQLLNVDF